MSSSEIEHVSEAQVPVHVTPTEIPVANFEGEFIRTMEGKLPAIVMEMPVGYARGTHLKLEVEVRIKSVAINEDRKGDLTRSHAFALEEVKLLGAYTADQLDPGVGGTASVGAPDPDDDETDETHAATSTEETPDVGF